MQHCSQPFWPYVQTDINATGLIIIIIIIIIIIYSPRTKYNNEVHGEQLKQVRQG